MEVLFERTKGGIEKRGCQGAIYGDKERLGFLIATDVSSQHPKRAKK
jgi:hypothetical protein